MFTQMHIYTYATSLSVANCKHAALKPNQVHASKAPTFSSSLKNLWFLAYPSELAMSNEMKR